MFDLVKWNRRRFFSWDLDILFISTVISHQSIYVVVTGNLDIVTRMFNINSIKIFNNIKVGKGFI